MQDLKFRDLSLESNNDRSQSNQKTLNPEPQEIRSNCYFGKAKAKSGEDVYLWMELITEQNEPFWRQYVTQTKVVANRGGGFLLYLLAEIQQNKDENDNEVSYGIPNDEEVCKISGFTKQEFNEYLHYVGKQCFDKPKKLNAMMSNFPASAVIDLFENDSHYIVFATKSPHFLIQSIPLLSGDRKTFTVKEYNQWYQDLLVCVGCHFNFPEMIHHRGIFRNPSSIIDDTHKGISMLLHSFSAAVVNKFFKEKELLKVKPISSMQYILGTSLRQEDVEITGSNLQTELENSKNGDACYEHPPNYIKIRTLAQYYYNNGTTKDSQPDSAVKDIPVVDSTFNFFNPSLPTPNSGAVSSLDFN